MNESDMSMNYPKQPFIMGHDVNFANYINNNNNNHNSILNNQFLNDTMLMQNPNNFNKQTNINNKINKNNNNFDDTINNSTNTINNQTLTNQSGIQMFPANLLHPMQPGLFMNPSAPKVIYPQIDPAKNLNFFIPNTNIFHPNLILEPVEIENIFKLNKKFNIAYEQSLWYIFNPLNASVSLPLSSKQICDMYNMKLINGEVDIRPIDVFQFKSKSLFSFAKLKMLNDPEWVEDLVDSQVLKYSGLGLEIEKLKNLVKDFKESEKNNFVVNNNNVGNVNNINSKEEKVSDDNFEVVGAKKGKNAFVSNNNNNNNNGFNANKGKKPVASQAIGAKNNFVPASSVGTIINKNDFNSVPSKNNVVKPVTQSNANNLVKNVNTFAFLFL